MKTETIIVGSEEIHTLPELLRPGLKAIIIGINPSPGPRRPYYQGQLGQRLWQRLSTSRILTDLPEGQEDVAAFRQGFGFTDLIRRPTARAAELTVDEISAAVPDLLSRVQPYRKDDPLILFVFKQAADAVGAHLEAEGFRTMKLPAPFQKEGRSRHEHHQARTRIEMMNEVTRFKSGYVYVAAAYDDGLVKFGYTYQNPRRRMQQLSTSSVGNFQLLYVVESSAPKWLEQRLHQCFAERRYNKSREFFRVSLNEIKQAVRELSEEQRYKEDLDKARAQLANATIWTIRGWKPIALLTKPAKTLTWPEKAMLATLFVLVAIAVGAFNTWLVSGFDWAVVEETPLWTFVFTTLLPFGWFGLAGLIAFAHWIIRQVDWPKNRGEIEELQQRLAREMSISPADLNI